MRWQGARMAEFQGSCLCGAVTITARAPVAAPIMRACHCDMCRKHNSGPFISLDFPQDGIRVEGNFAEYDSSDWATRGFCPTCGSTLWYSTKHDGARYLAAGLFENAAGAVLSMEFYEDQCPHGYALAGDHSKLSTQETIALFAPEEGETT